LVFPTAFRSAWANLVLLAGNVFRGLWASLQEEVLFRECALRHSPGDEDRLCSISASPIIDRWWLVVAPGSIVVGTTKPATEKATATG
jgi:hypothetical protein